MLYWLVGAVVYFVLLFFTLAFFKGAAIVSGPSNDDD
jgi:hypothetical protein